MKKTLCLILSAALALSLAACSSGTPAGESKPGDEMELSDIMSTILTDVSNLPDSNTMELGADQMEYSLFITPPEGSQAYVSEALINIVPHSVVLLRVPDDADAAAVAAQVEENANPNKWICVSADKTLVSQHGSTILLVMSTVPTANAISANFDALWA